MSDLLLLSVAQMCRLKPFYRIVEDLAPFGKAAVGGENHDLPRVISSGWDWSLASIGFLCHISSSQDLRCSGRSIQ